MGQIIIEVKGSFGDGRGVFYAIDHGHAHAVNKAMIWLNEVMREAINSDHKCHEDKEMPEQGFNVQR